MVGEGVGPTEFTAVLFELDGLYLAAATLRPETVYGTTNVWIRPDVEYALVDVEGKKVVVSKEAAFKLSEQIDGVREVGSVSGKDLIGKWVKVPITGARVPVLPAEFVRTELGTGVVYSVPAHAPYDYAALRDLKRDPSKLEAFGIGRDLVERMEPIPIAVTEGLGKMPAVELVESRGIRDQNDPALEELTSFVYSEEFYKGRMNERCGDLAGVPVKEARDLIKERLRSVGLGFPFYDLTERVVCRSGDECIVKVVKDQWFLTYSDEDWKELARECVRSMNVFPEGVRQWFLNVIDWLKDWPCARKTGLGTRLPFDEEWIVETLSDSTVYMALYTISHYVNSGKVSPEQLTYEVLDYVFRGNGDPDRIAMSVGLDPETLRRMREEFEYWYPVDLRFSAKDLVPNHLTFFVFQHVALFERSKWPRGVAANGIVRVEGEEMHKTKGNFIPIKLAISKYGADASRLALLLAAEDMDDPDWRERNAIEYRRTLDNVLKIAQEVSTAVTDSEMRRADRWLMAELSRILKVIEDAMEVTKTRTAANAAVYLMLNAWRRYVRRRGGSIGPAAKDFVKAWAVALSPFAPFTAEEMNRVLGGKDFVARSSWPVVKLDGLEEVLIEEEVLDSLVEDVKSIVHVMGKQPNSVKVLVAPQTFTGIYLGILEEVAARGSADIGRWVRSFPQEVDKGAAANLVRRFVELARALLQRYSADAIRSAITKERAVYEEEIEYLRRELGCEVVVTEADYAHPDPMRKALQAIPLRPGVVVS
jgi:leucyl-tRNA synthetase